MTETLLQKLEEKTMTILAELEKLRGEVKQLKSENQNLHFEKEANTRKIQDLVSILDSTASEEVIEPVFLKETTVSAA